ncbi:type IV secretion system DNA-binding domain-containing protein [Ochrobactrum oryzae]|nr:type IV secretion system DNA-binding domain-containing protein [Brucella oryzae]
MSTLGQLETNMRLLEMLATAWPTYEGRQRFRLREWLVNKTDQRTVIVQHSGRYAELSDGWISALYAVAVSTVTDSNLLSDHDLRRIWFFLDEWGQLPEIQDFERFVTLGRSKGSVPFSVCKTCHRSPKTTDRKSLTSSLRLLAQRS